MRTLPTPVVPQFLAGLCLLAFPLAKEVSAQIPVAPLVRDVCGTVQGAGDERVRVTVYQNDTQAASLEPMCEGFTSADGTFAFRAVPWLTREQWRGKTVIVVARSTGHVGLLTIRPETTGIDKLLVDLQAAQDSSGIVRSKDTGQPLAGVGVSVRILGEVPGSAVWFASPLPLWSATTDAEGRFTLKGLPRIAPIHLIAGSDAFARTPITVSDPKKAVVIELEPAGTIRGIVLMPDGKPAVRCRVTATGRAASLGRTMTDDDGRFCLGGLSADTYKVFAEAPDLTVIAIVGLAVAAGSEIENQQVQLVHGGFIVGRIVDKATGAPIVPGPHTDVAMYGPARGPGGSCEATPVLPDGTFRIRAPAGRNRIYLRGAEGWSEPSEYVEVVEGQETKVEWKVEKRGAIKK